MESLALTEDERLPPLSEPSHLGSRFYKLLAGEFFSYGMPVLCGEHPYYHIRMMRDEASFGRFSILETPPRTPYEAAVHARKYKESGTNVAIIYRGRATGNNMLNAFAFNITDGLLHEHRIKARLIDFSAAAQLQEKLPDDVYEDFARISSTGPNKGGVLVGDTAEKHLAKMKEMGVLGFNFDEVRAPSETQAGANMIAKNGGKIIAVDLRRNPARWDGFYVLDIDRYVCVAMSLAKWI